MSENKWPSRNRAEDRRLLHAESEFVQRDRSLHPPALTPNYKTTVLRSPRIPLWSLQNSLSEVTGPVLTREDIGPIGNDIILNYAKEGSVWARMTTRGPAWSGSEHRAIDARG